MNPKTIPHLFFDACKKYNKKDAVLVRRNGHYEPISHLFFRQRVLHFGRGLLTLGLQADEKVAILAETRFEWAIADQGILCTGAVNVPIYASNPPNQIAYIMTHADVVGLVVSSQDLLFKIQSIQHELPKLRFIILMDEISGPLPSKVLSMAQVEAKGSQTDNELDLNARWMKRSPDALLTLIYTSGTTGNPKGVMLSHANLISNVKSCEPYMPFGPTDIHLSHLPLSHALERMGGYYCMLLRGVTIAYAQDVKTVQQDLLEVRPTILISVPRLFEKIHERVLRRVRESGFVKRQIFKAAVSVGKKAMPFFNRGKDIGGLLGYKWRLADKMVFSKVKEATGGRIKYLLSGGAPLSKEVAEAFVGMGMRIAEGYGLTETSPVLTINRENWNKPGTVGLPVDKVEIKIAADGEILAKGPNIMLGYYKDPQGTAEALVDGWFHTGDIGTIDEDGFLSITDRKKDLIVTSGGKKIAPQPLEVSLTRSPLIENAIIIGDRRNFITALLVPPWDTIDHWAPLHKWPNDPAQLIDDPSFLKALDQEVQAQMVGFAHHELVKRFKVLPKPLTVEDRQLTPTLKVRRREVCEQFKSLIDEMYRTPTK